MDDLQIFDRSCSKSELWLKGSREAARALKGWLSGLSGPACNALLGTALQDQRGARLRGTLVACP